jgi:hypothetical protein
MTTAATRKTPVRTPRRKSPAATAKPTVLETVRKEATAPRIAAAVGFGAAAAIAGYFSNTARRERALTGAKDLYTKTRSRANELTTNLTTNVKSRFTNEDGSESNIVEGKFAAA